MTFFKSFLSTLPSSSVLRAPVPVPQEQQLGPQVLLLRLGAADRSAGLQGLGAGQEAVGGRGGAEEPRSRGAREAERRGRAIRSWLWEVRDDGRVDVQASVFEFKQGISWYTQLTSSDQAAVTRALAKKRGGKEDGAGAEGGTGGQDLKFKLLPPNFNFRDNVFKKWDRIGVFVLSKSEEWRIIEDVPLAFRNLLPPQLPF